MVGGISNGGGKITYSEVREASPDEIGKGIGDGLDGETKNFCFLITWGLGTSLQRTMES